MRWRSASCVACAAVLLAAAAAGAGPDPRSREIGVPRIVNYDPREEAPWIGLQSWAAIQDPRGVMYFGNTAGLVEYDGVTWRLIPLQPAGTVRSLARDADGRIFVGGQGTFGTLEVVAGGQLRYRDLLEHVPPDQRGFTDVWKTHATSDGVFFQTFTHLFRWSDGGLRVWRPDTSFHMSFVVRDRVYVRQEGFGLLVVDGDALELVPHGEAFADQRVYVMLEHGDDEILVGTRERGLVVLGPDGIRRFETEADAYLVDSQLYDGVRLADGSVALATLRGGAVLVGADGHVLHVLDRTLGVSSSTVTSVFADDRGGLWLTLDRNLSRVEIPAAFTSFDESTGLEGLVQTAHRHGGRLYAATTLGVYRLEPPSPSERRPAPVARFVPVTGVASQAWDLLSADGELVAATTDGVYAIRGLEARRIADGRALALARSRLEPGRLYVGLLDGFAVLDPAPGGGWTRSDVEGLRDEIRSIAETADGAVMLGGRYRGVWRCVPPPAPGGRWLVHAMAEDSGLPLGHGRTSVGWVGDRLLVGTSAGLVRFDPDSQRFEPATEFGEAFVRPQCSITEMHEDPAGRLWLVATPEPGFGVAERTADGWRFESEAFRRLAPRTIWGVFVDADGIVWISSSVGLIRYDTAVGRRIPPELRCLIRDVRTLADGVVLYRGGADATPPRWTVPYTRNSLRFEYAAPHLGGESLVEYQTFLQGFDRDWSPWSRETWREVTNLPEDRYRFLVRARTGGGQVSPPAELELRVEPPWYRRWWAQLGFLAVGVAGFVGSVRWQVRRARKIERARAENRRREYELQRAQSIQRHMLPSHPPALAHLDIAAVQHTATEVGGDYYDFFPQDSGTLFAAVGDATGHGLGAGLMVAATRTALLTIRNASLVEVATTLNQVLRRVNLGARLNMALTLVELGRPRADDGRIVVRASGGGMAPMYVVRRDGGVEEHVVAGVPLGALPDPEYGLVSLELAPGDALVLMSDGIAERRHPVDGQLGFGGVLRMLSDVAARHAAVDGVLTAHELLGSIVESSRVTSGETPIDDDVTVVVIRLNDRRPGAAAGVR